MFVIKSLPVQLFFVNDSTPTEIYTLSLHDALPISYRRKRGGTDRADAHPGAQCQRLRGALPALDPGGVSRPPDLLRGTSAAPRRRRVRGALPWGAEPSRARQRVDHTRDPLSPGRPRALPRAVGRTVAILPPRGLSLAMG